MTIKRRFNDSLPLMLLRAREAVMSRFRPILYVNGITEQQWRTLRALEDMGELSAAGLAAECSILAPSMTRILRKLSEQDLVSVSKSPRDQRELKVRISPKGQQLVNSIGPLLEEQYTLLREQLSSERMIALHRELMHLIELGAPPEK
jgi:homoprotocatechuate degradation regulator HpaR